MIERQATRSAAARAIDASPEPVAAPAEPAPMLVAVPPQHPSEARFVVPIPEARLDLQDGGPWTV
jgi:hypothetical protein